MCDETKRHKPMSAQWFSVIMVTDFHEITYREEFN
jgi:hypothetical protein